MDRRSYLLIKSAVNLNDPLLHKLYIPDTLDWNVVQPGNLGTALRRRVESFKDKIKEEANNAPRALQGTYDNMKSNQMYRNLFKRLGVNNYK